MVLISVRMKHLKLAVFLIFLTVVAALTVLAVLSSRSGAAALLSTTAERTEFLHAHGISAEGETAGVVTIPTEWNAAFTDYNDLQKEQNLDLSRYKGRVAECYSYSGDGGAFVTLLMYEGKVIAYDCFNYGA